MKRLLLIAFTLFGIIANGQPQAINYQGVARDSQGHPLINRNVSLKLSILDSSATGNSVYAETHSVTTNASGLFNIAIGNGVLVSGTFAGISWGQGDKWLKTEIDTSGGSNYQLVGTTQFLSVPYAIYSKSSGPRGTNIGDMQYWNGSDWITIIAGNPGQVLTLNENSIPTWKAQRLFIGDIYQGGIIFYLFKQGDSGYDQNQQHGLIAALYNQGFSQWGCQGISIGTSNLIGTGASNTLAIINDCNETGIAARICNDLVLDGYSDWYLPSKDELNLMYLNRAIIGGFTNNYYWTSSQSDENFAWYQSFPDGSLLNYPYGKAGGFYIRAIRSF